jgi:hypothetical protein
VVDWGEQYDIEDHRCEERYFDDEDEEGDEAEMMESGQEDY